MCSFWSRIAGTAWDGSSCRPWPSIPELKGLRQVLLATADAHELYRSYGFTETQPGRMMAIRQDPTELYKQS